MASLDCVFVKDAQNKTHTIHNVGRSITVATFKTFVEAKTGVEPPKQRLIYGAKQLKDEMTLADYNIHSESTIFMVLRLLGGGDEGVPNPDLNATESDAFSDLTEGKNIGFATVTKNGSCVCYCSEDNDWKFRLKQCTHVMCHYDFKNAIKACTDKRGLAILCTVTGCGTPMEYDQISQYAKMTCEEQKTNDERLATALIKASPSMNICPRCEAFLFREHRENKITCPSCNGEPWCWLCLKTWQSTNGTTVCGNNNDCGGPMAFKINALENCPTKTISGIPNVPSIRMCPQCENIIEHEDACKHMTCSKNANGCGYEFCFSCLKQWNNCNLSTTCTVAGTQTPTQNTA